MDKKEYIRKWNWIQIEFQFSWNNDLKIKLQDISKLFILKWCIYFFLVKNNKILLKIKLGNIDKEVNNYLNLLTSSSLNTYSPEIYQFWWKIWWEITEKYFCKISEHIISNVDILYENKEKYLTIIIIDLLSKFSSDSWEIWDIIQRFMEIRGFKNNFNGYFSINIKDYIKNCDMNILSYFLSQNHILEELLSKNKFNLIFNIKNILPFYIVFIFNMFYLSKVEQNLIISKLCITLNKHKYE
jgi:hypothetical protein